MDQLVKLYTCYLIYLSCIFSSSSAGYSLLLICSSVSLSYSYFLLLYNCLATFPLSHYHIAGNFQVIKLSRIGAKYNFRRENSPIAHFCSTKGATSPIYSISLSSGFLLYWSHCATLLATCRVSSWRRWCTNRNKNESGTAGKITHDNGQTAPEKPLSSTQPNCLTNIPPNTEKDTADLSFDYSKILVKSSPNTPTQSPAITSRSPSWTYQSIEREIKLKLEQLAKSLTTTDVITSPRGWEWYQYEGHFTIN